MRKPYLLFFLVLVCLLAPAAVQAALLDGQSIGVRYHYPVYGSDYAPPSFHLVGLGVEIASYPSDAAFSIDFSDHTILMTFLWTGTWSGVISGASFNGPVFFDGYATIPDFMSVTIDPSTTMPLFSPGNVGFDANNIWINWMGMDFATGQTVKLRINGGDEEETGAIPEPSTAGLAGLALSAFALLARRRSRNPVRR